MSTFANTTAKVLTSIDGLLAAFEQAYAVTAAVQKRQAIDQGLEAYHFERANDGSHYLISYHSRDGIRVTAFTGKFFPHDSSKNEFKFGALEKSGLDATDGLVRAITLQNPLRLASQ